MTYKELRKIMSKKSLNDLILKIREIISDPRSTKKGCGVCVHALDIIVFILIISKICGIKSYRLIEYFTRTHIIFLEKYFKEQIEKLKILVKEGKIKKVLPSDDTFRRVIEKISPEELFKIYEWVVNAINNNILKRCHIAIDGKCLKGTQTIELKARDVVSAFNCENFFTISQEEVPEKKNEITAILKLLENIEEYCYKNLVITIDAIAANTRVVDSIVRKGWDYCIAFKENQLTCFNYAYSLLIQNLKNYFYSESYNKHGIQGERRYYFFENLERFPKINEFSGLKSIGAIISFGVRKGEEFAEVRFFFTSLTSKNEFKEVARAPWKIENNLHRSLDVFYEEDKSHIKKENAPLNISTLRKIGLALLLLGKLYARDKNITSNILIEIFKINPYVIDQLLSDEYIEILS